MAASRPDPRSAFWQTLIRFDSAKLTPGLALRNTLGVVLPLIAGLAAGNIGGGIAVATGALNAGFSDAQEPYRLRAKRMLAASLLVGFAVFAGETSGRWPVAAVATAALWAMAAGMMLSLSSAAGDLGLVSLVTLVVYAASPQPLGRAVSAGALAFAGGLLQTGLSLALWPLRRYTHERRALSALYLELARAAGGTIEATQSPPASAQATAAEAALSAMIRDHSVEAERYRLLLAQAERIRLSILTLTRLRTRIERERSGGEPAPLVASYLTTAAELTTHIGELLESSGPVPALDDRVEFLEAASEALRDADAVEPVAAMLEDARTQMDALNGQLRAAFELASNTSEEGLSDFEQREQRRPWNLRLSGTLATLRANWSLDAAVFRHAVRLAVCVGVADALARALSVQRTYWLPMTVAIVLKPDFTSTFSRGVLRLAGTLAGLLVATGLFHLFPARVPTSIAMIAVFMFALRWVGSANYGVFVTAVTALVVFLIGLTGVSAKDVMLARAINTALGGVIALVAYAAWPTWERTQVPEAIARMLDAYRAYFRAVREAFERADAGVRPEIEQARGPARLARSNLEASIDRLLAEPGITPGAASLLAGILASSHRMVHAMMALESALSASVPAPARAAFPAFANGVEFTLYYLANALRGSALSADQLPDLREAHHALQRSGDSRLDRYTLVNIETDRITNSLNTLSGEILSLMATIELSPPR